MWNVVTFQNDLGHTWPNLVLAKLGLAKLGLGKTWFGQTWSRPACSPSVVVDFGQFRLQPISTFFSRNEFDELLCPIAQNCVPASHAYLASQMASCTHGTVPSEPPGTRPKKYITNAFAAAHASNLCHRLTHARRASACSSSGKSRTLAHAR